MSEKTVRNGAEQTDGGSGNVLVCVSALAVPHLRSVDVSWCKVVGGRLALLLDALQPSVIVELRLSSCRLSADDLHHLGNRITNINLVSPLKLFSSSFLCGSHVNMFILKEKPIFQ